MGYFNQPLITLQPNLYLSSGNDALSFTLNDATDEFAIAFVLPTSDLAKIAVGVSAKTGTPVAYDIRIETDDGSGRPSGTLGWTDATAQIAANASAGFTSLLSLTAAGGTKGTLYHARIKANTDPANTNYIAMRMNGQAGGFGVMSNRGVVSWASTSASGAAFASGSGAPLFLGEDSSGNRFGQHMIAGSLLTVTNTAWKGCKFVCPTSGTYWGCSFSQLNSTSAGTVSAKLIDNSNTVLATGALSAGVWDILTSRTFSPVFAFDTPQSLTSGSTYRCVWKDTAGNQRMDVITTLSSTYKAIKPGGSDYILTQGTSSDGTASPSSWTDDDTSEPTGFALYGSAASGGGGGGLVNPIISASGGLIMRGLP